MATDVIKEFLVSLSYKIEAGQESKFKRSIESATATVMDLGKAAAVASAAVSAAVVKISRSFDSLYWQAQRTQTTVSQIKAVSYAVSQLGGSAESAGSSIETFGKNLKWNPGFEGFLKQIGVVTRENGKLRDSVALLKDFANTIKGRSRAEQMGLAEFAGIDLKTLEALQNGQLAKRMAEHSATLKRLGVDEDEASRKANALQVALGKLSDTLGGIGTLLLDRFGPGLTSTFEKLDEFLVQNSDKIVDFFDKLGKVASELAGIFEKLLEVLGPLWQKFDNLTQSIAGVDGLTAALVALIGLKVSGWLLGVAAAIAKVGTAASVALLGGSLGKFLRLFGIGGAIALGMSPTEANGGEDQEIARRRAAGTFGPAGAGDLEADAAKRQQGQSKDTSLWGKVKRWWNGGGDPANGAATAPKGSAAKLAAAQEAYDFWRSKGLSHEAASGLVANEEAESAFNPNARGDGGRAHGLYQHHPDRRANILRGTGIDMSSADARQQREGAHWEMTKGQERKTWNMLQGVTSAGEAGAIVSREYERPADRAGEASKRAAAANGWAARLQQQSTDETPSAATASGHQEAYRRKTGRDLQADINSKDPYVRDWAAKEAGVTQGPQSDDVVRPKSWQDREREADRQTDMGRVQAYENNLPGGDKAEAAKDQAESKAEKSSGFKVDNRLGENERGNAASNSLFSGQGLADQKLDGRLTKTKEATASLFNPESPLIRAADNAAKVEGGGLGGNGSALTPPPASTAGTNITINQENHTSVTGSGDPHDTAQRIGNTQRDVNAGMVRDLKGAVR